MGLGIWKRERRVVLKPEQGLSEPRRLRSFSYLASLWYVSTRGTHLATLRSIGPFQVTSIASWEGLVAAEAQSTPDLVLVELTLGWGNPWQIAQRLNRSYNVPMIALCQENAFFRAGPIKQAFAAGVTDTLFEPITSDELRECLDVLLKLQKLGSHHH